MGDEFKSYFGELNSFGSSLNLQPSSVENVGGHVMGRPDGDESSAVDVTTPGHVTTAGHPNQFQVVDLWQPELSPGITQKIDVAQSQP